MPANKGKLVDLLKYHVVSGSVKSSALSDGQQVETLLSGSKVSVSIIGGTVRVGGAKVSSADVMASNGVVHVIDSVMVPAALSDWITAASVSIVEASITVSGATQSELLDNPTKQVAIRNGFAEAIGITNEKVKIVKIGSRVLARRTRRLESLSIDFEITVDGATTPASVAKKVQQTSPSAFAVAIEK